MTDDLVTRLESLHRRTLDPTIREALVAVAAATAKREADERALAARDAACLQNMIVAAGHAERANQAEAALTEARGVIAADDARLRAAEARVWPDGTTYGCDAPDQLAEEVLTLRQRLIEAERARDAYRAVLDSAGYERLDDLPSLGIEFAQTLGQTARDRTLEALAALTEAQRERDAAWVVAIRQADACRTLRQGASPSYVHGVGTCCEDAIPRERWCLYCDLADALNLVTHEAQATAAREGRE